MRFFLCLALCLFTFKNCLAINIISDDQTQSYIFDILTPIFEKAELPLDFDKVFIVNDNSLNAFVGDRNNMFIHTGTILSASNTNEIEGVLAHETGHILGGHILRQKIKMQDLQTATLASLVAAVGAAAISGRGDAAMAVVLGSQSSALNAMTAYQLTEERAADETAVMLLNKNNKSLEGLKSFMQKLQNTNRLQGIEESVYFRTHPVTRERISFFDNQAKQQGDVLDNIELDERLKIIQAKLFAFMAPVDDVIKKYPNSDVSTEGLLARTVYYMRKKDFANAIKYVNRLIKKDDKNPYYWELKSQVMFEGGRLNEAKTSSYKAYILKPYSKLLALNYAGIALDNDLSQKELKDVIILLEKVNDASFYPITNYLLGKAYNILGDEGISNYYLAEYNYLRGQNKQAIKFLNKSLKLKPRADVLLKAKDLSLKIKSTQKKKSLL